MWHHATEECIPWHTQETINALKEICKDQSCWSCQKCTGIMKKLNGRLAKLETDVKTVQDNVETLNTNQESTDETVSQLRADFNEFKGSFDNVATEEEKVNVLTEMKDREEKKLNVIINGVKESSATEKTEVQAEENTLLDKLFNDMQLNPATTSENIHFKTRLGSKQPGRERPFLVKFRDRRTRDDVLRNARKITTPGVRIKPDLTKLQRQEDEKFKKQSTKKTMPNQKMIRGSIDGRWQDHRETCARSRYGTFRNGRKKQSGDV
jgi:peptidoglycan hydrolase CwlO-like protein